jgi:hypothetical protein
LGGKHLLLIDICRVMLASFCCHKTSFLLGHERPWCSSHGHISGALLTSYYFSMVNFSASCFFFFLWLFHASATCLFTGPMGTVFGYLITKVGCARLHPSLWDLGLHSR